jgi:hypothetical protein
MRQNVRQRLRIIYEVHGPRGERSRVKAHTTCGRVPTTPPADLRCIYRYRSDRIRIGTPRRCVLPPCDAKHATSCHGPVVYKQRKPALRIYHRLRMTLFLGYAFLCRRTGSWNCIPQHCFFHHPRAWIEHSGGYVLARRFREKQSQSILRRCRELTVLGTGGRQECTQVH